MTRALAVLRPEPGNAATAARIEALGFRAIRLPLFSIRPLAWTAPDPAGFDALLLTSANAVRHAGAGLRTLAELPVVAVGAATARAAEAEGLTVASIGGGDVAAAIALSGRRRLLHLCGRNHVPAGVATIPVYAADVLPLQDAGVLAGTVALVHSVRAARRLVELVTRDRIADLRIAAISDPVRAAGLDVVGGVAERPDDPALIALAARLAAD